MLYTTEPAKVFSVRAVQVQPSDIQGSYIHQTISWRRPDNHVHITHYLIRYGAGVISRDTEGGGLPTVNSTTNSTVLMLSKPTSHTTYSVWVAAVSQAGEGKFSDRVDFNYSSKPTNRLAMRRTHNQKHVMTSHVHIAPDPPTGVNSVNSTCNSITITWSAPHYTGGVPLEGYAVRVRGRGSPLTTDGPDMTAVTVTHLSPNTSYTIDVRAVNAIGEGQRSKQIIAITALQG